MMDYKKIDRLRWLIVFSPLIIWTVTVVLLLDLLNDMQNNGRVILSVSAFACLGIIIVIIIFYKKWYERKEQEDMYSQA